MDSSFYNVPTRSDEEFEVFINAFYSLSIGTSAKAMSWPISNQTLQCNILHSQSFQHAAQSKMTFSGLPVFLILDGTIIRESGIVADYIIDLTKG